MLHIVIIIVQSYNLFEEESGAQTQVIRYVEENWTKQMMQCDENQMGRGFVTYWSALRNRSVRLQCLDLEIGCNCRDEQKQAG